MKRKPAWACKSYDAHTADAFCDACLASFRDQKSETRYSDLPPRVPFARGWLGVGATHWFDATDDVVLPSKDGRRVMAQAVCGAVCEMTLTWAPRAGRECRKCLSALRKAGRLDHERGRAGR